MEQSHLQNCASMRNLISNLMYELTGEHVALSTQLPTNNNNIMPIFANRDFTGAVPPLCQRIEKHAEEHVLKTEALFLLK